MKKTLCKSIHKKDANIFINIEDIVELQEHCEMDDNLYLPILVKGCPHPVYVIDNYDLKSTLREDIIKELEEFYET